MQSMSPMPLSNQQDFGYEFSVHASYKMSKINENFSDCQDCYGFSTDNLGIAISDGATQSFYSGPWAEILCNSYCSRPKPLTPQCWKDWLSKAQNEWIHHIKQKLGELREAGKPSWIECLNGLEMKKDAFATFIGMHLEGLYIRGIAIGDSCGLLIKHSRIDSTDVAQSDRFTIVRAFPGLWKHSFSNNTIGLPSYPKSTAHAPEFFDVPVPQDGESYLVVLATDALAEYIFKKESEGDSIIFDLLTLKSEEKFFEYVTTARNQGLANDDTTLVVASITRRVPDNESPDPLPITCEIQSSPQATEAIQIISRKSEEYLSTIESINDNSSSITRYQPGDTSKSDEKPLTTSSPDSSNQQDSISIVTDHSKPASQDLISLASGSESCDSCSPDVTAPSAASDPPALTDAHSESPLVRTPMSHSEVSLPTSLKKK
jgi:hypothetical protein